MAIGLMKLWPVEALQDGGLSLDRADAIAGTAMAVFFSLANGIGRLAWGAMSDRVGRKNSVVIMAATYMTRQPALGLTDAGFWQIFAAGMLTSAIIINLADCIKSRRDG